MKINPSKNRFYWLYITGIFLILTLHILDLPPWFFPTDWAKTLVFRCIMAVLLLLFSFQILYRENEVSLPNIKKNKLIWILGSLLVIFLLASIFSVDLYFSFWGSPDRAGGFINFAFYIIFSVFIFLITKKDDWKKIWNFSIFIGVIVSAIAVIQFHGLLSKIFLPVSSQPPSTLGNPIMLGTYLLIIFFITLSFAIKEKKLLYKFLYICSLLLFVYVILITEVRAAYLGLIIGALYFFLFYPTKKYSNPVINDLKQSPTLNWVRHNKLKIAKIGIILVLIGAIAIVYYVNTRNQFPNFLEKSRLFQRIKPRLSINLVLSDARFSTWGIGLKALAEKPILGWGPENFSVGFDKYYDPAIPSLSGNNQSGSNWWDKPHNVFLEIATTAGIPALIIYLVFLVFLFWQLQKIKLKSEGEDQKMIISGVQTALIGYVIAILFSFDNASTYILFFTLVGFSLHLIYSEDNQQTTNEINFKPIKGRSIIAGILLIILVIFLWQYNFVPFQSNILLNEAQSFTNTGNCDQAFSLMDKAIENHSILDSYLKLKYVEFIKACARIHPENNLSYAKKGAEILKEALKLQPLSTRSWILLGSFTEIVSENEQDPAKQKSLINESNSYFEKAFNLSPKRQELFIEWSKIDIVTGDYQDMKQKTEKCVNLNPGLADCYWARAVAEVYSKEYDKAKADINIANGKHFDSRGFITQLADAYIPSKTINSYISNKDYQELAPIYEQLIYFDEKVSQYHASLAFIYRELGRYKDARDQALKYWSMLGSTDDVKAFLETLPKEFSTLPDMPTR